MKIVKLLIIVIAIIAAILISFFAYSGFFRTVQVQEKEVGPFKFAMHEYYGDYKLSGKHMDSLYYALKNNGFDTEIGFGIYYDNPKEVPVDQLHSIVGCVIKPSDYERVGELVVKGFRIEDMGKTNAMVVEFPKKNNFSIMAGVKVVYPVLEEYRVNKDYQPQPALELYYPDKIVYAVEIKKQ